MSALVARPYTRVEVAAMAEFAGWLKSEKGIDVWPALIEAMKRFPHEHSQSIIGPYCFACHIDLPAPYTTWADGQENTR